MEALENGRYSGIILSSKRHEGLLSSVTSYNEYCFNNSEHYHNNAHFSFVLNGGCVEKKKDDYEIKPGGITYYSAGEIHQVKKIAGVTRRINVEIEESFFSQYNFSDEGLRQIIITNPDAKFIMVKIYQELVISDNLSDITIQMLFLQLINQFETSSVQKKPQ